MKRIKLVPVCFKQGYVIPTKPFKAEKTGVNTCFTLRKGVSIMPANKKEQQNAKCQCGSGKKYGACCGSNEICYCGSGKKAGECCFK